MSRPLEIGVIGCGYWGPNLIRNFSSLPECRVRYACDINESRLSRMEKLYPWIETCARVDRLLDDEELDAVAIATPVHLHYQIAKKSLEAGKHTLIEKPMASSSEQCLELIKIAANKKLTLMVGHTFIYSAPVCKIREIVKAGELGDLLYISSQRLNLGLFQKDINVAWDLAPHDLSIVLHVMDELPLSVNCQGKAHLVPGIEDVTTMTLNFANGGFATIHSSWLDPNKVRRMTFVGSKKMLLYDDTEPLEKIKIYDKGIDVPPYYDTFGEFQYSYRYGDTYSPFLNLVEPLKEQCFHFVDCIQNGSKCKTGGDQGLQIVKILEAASESLQKDGARVYINWDRMVVKTSTT